MSDDMLAEYESHEQFLEPFSEYGAVIMQSGIPVRIKDSGGQGTFVRVPQPTAGEEGTVLTVQPSLSVDWTLPQLRMAMADISNATLRTTNNTTLVPAQGANTLIIPVSVTQITMYGGTNVWSTMGVAGIQYDGDAGTRIALPNAFFTTATSNMRHTAMSSNVETLSVSANMPVVYNMDAGGTGNAANDNTARVYITYYVVDV